MKAKTAAAARPPERNQTTELHLPHRGDKELSACSTTISAGELMNSGQSDLSSIDCFFYIQFSF